MQRVSILAIGVLALSACAPMDDQAAQQSFPLTSADQLPPPDAPVLLSLDAPNAATVGDTITFNVTGAGPNEVVRIYAAAGISEGVCPAIIGGLCVDLDPTSRFLQKRADANGDVTFTYDIPAEIDQGVEVFFQAAVRRGANGESSIVSNVDRTRMNDGSARVRIVHGSPDAPVVDLYANGGLLYEGLAYGDSTGYVTVPADTYDIDIRAAGASATSAPAFSVPGLVLDENTDYTALAAGFFGSANAGDQFRVIPFVDDFGSPAAGEYRARIIHASADAPSVDIDVGNDGSAEVPSLNRFANTGIDGVALPADTSLQVGIAGGALPVTIPALPTGARVQVIATGRLGADRPNEDDAFGLLAIIDDGAPVFIRQNPQVYVFHGSPDAPAVDIPAIGVDDLAFRDLQGPVTVPPASYDLDIFDETGTAYQLTYTTPNLMAGERYIAIATGFFGGASPGFQIIPLNDGAMIDDENATITAVHASPDAPAVQVGADLRGFVPLTGDIMFGDVTDIVAGPGTYDIQVADTSGNPLFTFAGLGLFEGDRYFGIANGSVVDGDFGITLIDLTAPTWTAATVFPTP